MPEDQEKSESETKFQTDTIRGLVILFYKNLLMPTHKQYTTAYSLCKALARRFNDEKKIKQLEYLYNNTTVGYPLGLVQIVVYRDLILGQSLNKTYNYGYHSKPVKVGDLVVALDTTLDKILDLFTELCVEHDIDPAITMPIIEGLDNISTKGGM